MHLLPISLLHIPEWILYFPAALERLNSAGVSRAGSCLVPIRTLLVGFGSLGDESHDYVYIWNFKPMSSVNCTLDTDLEAHSAFPFIMPLTCFLHQCHRA